MINVKVTNTKTGKTDELKGDFVCGFTAKIDPVFGASCEAFQDGYLEPKKALKLLDGYYKIMKKEIKAKGKK